MDRYGLIGKDIAYSFSKRYFSEKFSKSGTINASYENFDLAEIDAVESVFQNIPGLKGLNVTIPYKEAIIPFLSDLDPVAAKIRAVNTIALSSGKRIGYNTDVIGFRESLLPLLPKNCSKAMVLGTGGASKAVRFVLNELDLKTTLVSRKSTKGDTTYTALTPEEVSTHSLLINCTPLGTHPAVEEKPPIPYEGIGPGHLLYDLVYNPPKSAFLSEGEKQGAAIINGLRMLELQAEAAWQIWQENSPHETASKQ